MDNVVSWIGLISGILSLILVVWKVAFKQGEENRERAVMKEDIKDLKEITKPLTERVQKIESSNDVFWKVLEPHFANIIHSPQHELRDLLVEKLMKETLTYHEAVTLSMLLKDAADVETSPDKKIGFIFLEARAMSLITSGKLAHNDAEEVSSNDIKSDVLKLKEEDVKIVGELKVVSDIKPGDAVKVVGAIKPNGDMKSK